MNKILEKGLFLLFLFIPFAFTSAFGQTITISTVDQGPYGIGSTVAVPFNVTSGCIAQDNIFSLYLCNATGTPLSTTPVDTIKNFYGTFFNYTVPAGTPAGTYTFLIKSSDPAVSSIPSNTFTITNSTGSAASLSCPSVINPQYPQVFGTCDGSDNIQYTFNNSSASGSTVTASFFNELTQSFEVSNVNIATQYNFTAKAANYTVSVKAVSNGIVSTYAYQLINNVVNTSIGATGSPSVCLQGGGASLTYNIDVSSPTGIQYNYPGNTYTFKWGDGTTSTYTLCQIIAANGQITHVFKSPSCGITSNNHANSFEIDFQAKNNYCGNIGSAPSNYAKVYAEPINAFSMPSTACTGSSVNIVNTSSPGPDPNSVTSTCDNNSNALYSWSVDGVVVASSYPLSKNFIYNATHGVHTITIHFQNNTGPCTPADVSQNICVQDPPQPSFNIPQKTICIGSGPLALNNTSVIDATCNTNNTYKWTVTPGTGVSFNATSAQPQFVFSNTGSYIIGLTVTTASCGPVTAPNVDTVIVNSPPTAVLSPDFSTCGDNQTLRFNATQANNPTYTQLTGTSVKQPTTYTWNVIGPNAADYSFVAPSTVHSRYPRILFKDFGTYTISVTQQNTCGMVTSNLQHITFEQAPTVIAGDDTTICANTQATLNGTITGTGVLSYMWTGGTGTYTPSADSLHTQYQPSTAEVNAGQVTLTLLANTSVAAPCNTITSNVTITITPTDVIKSSLDTTICSNKRLNYTITAADSSTFTWTAQVASGNATGFSPTGTGSMITDSLINTSASTNAVIAYTITPISSDGCPGTPSTLNVTVTPLPIITATPANPVICSNQAANIVLASSFNGTSYTWISTATGGVTGNTDQNAAATTPSIQDILVNNGTSAASVTYTITPYNSNSCPGTPVVTTINVQPLPVTSNAGKDTSLCNTLTYTLQGNAPAPGSGKWTVVTGSGVTFANDTIPNTTVSGLVGGNIYQFEWTITSAPGCQSQSTVTVNVNVPTVPGTTSATGPTTICAGTNNGQINLTGQTGKVLRWEQSVDSVNWTTVIPIDTLTDLIYTNLSQTTYYRAVVQNGACSFLPSTATKITVNQPPIVANAGRDTTLCNGTIYVLQGNNPGAFSGVWRQVSGPAITFADSTQYNTTISNLQEGNIYSFTWTIFAVSPCTNSQAEVTINDAADVIASFNADKTDVCGTQTITFTNTSNNQTGATFLWDFGDGSTSNVVSPQHQFQQTTNGHDTTYIVSLTVLSNCHQHPPVFDTITVRPATPIASIQPQTTSGCSPFTITVNNTSPGNNVSYKFYLYDGSTLVQEIDKTDKSSASFNPVNVTNPQIYDLFMVATGYCGAVDTSDIIPVKVAPPTIIVQTYALNGDTAGCAPFTPVFVNNSTGGSSFHYNIYDSNGNLIAQPIAGTANFPYTFNTIGTYFVTLTASNSCTTGAESKPRIEIDVYPEPAPSFTTSTDCANNVTFTNTTPDNGTTQASSLIYVWDFGDRSAGSNLPSPQHKYDYTKSPFTVTLTATNSITGCASIIKQTLNVSAPLVAEFTELPDSIITIPNYHFTFEDETTGAPTTWSWTFGDGNTSTSRNPEHTYLDTGYYTVTLTTTSAAGCTSTITHIVRITGTPGQLFMPNAFMPTSGTLELRTFLAKGSGIKAWKMQIFNNYGQLMWETTRLDDKGAPVDGWDGTYKGTLMPQGAYIWQASATFINGTSWKGMSYNNSLPKRTGTVNLIR